MAELFTLPEINSALAYFENTYPAHCRRIELPNKTFEGRTSFALHIGLPNERKNHASLITSGVHAREWGGPDIAICFAGDILRAYSEGKGLQYNKTTFSALDIKRIFEETTLIVFPCVNPDGLEYSRDPDVGYAFWRKNRSLEPGRKSAAVKNVLEEGRGVDINRNYDFLWDFRRHFHKDALREQPNLSSDERRSSIYHGTAPFSEPESRNVKYLMDSFPGLRWFLDLHSFGGDVLHSWGDSPNQTTRVSMSFDNPSYDGFRGRKNASLYGEFIDKSDASVVRGSAELICEAINGVWGRQYEVKQSFLGYCTSGTGDDYAFSRHFVLPDAEKTYAFTVEFNAGKGNPKDLNNFIATTDKAYLDEILAEVIPGLITFAQFATKQPTFAHAPHVDLTDQISYTDLLTGKTITIGAGGLIVQPPPPDWYVTDLGRQIGQLLATHENLSRMSGQAIENVRSSILDNIALLAKNRKV